MCSSDLTATRARAPRTAPEVRRLQLLDTAERLLGDGGIDALRMDAIARAAGVTRPVVYEHFSDRDGVVIALLQRHALRVAAHVSAATATAQTFEEELERATRAYLTVAIEHGRAMRALVSAEYLSPAIERARRTHWEAAATTWAHRYRRHAGVSQRDARALATAHLAALSALAGLCIDRRLSPARATEIHVRSTLAALDTLGAAHKEQ